MQCFRIYVTLPLVANYLFFAAAIPLLRIASALQNPVHKSAEELAAVVHQQGRIDSHQEEPVNDDVLANNEEILESLAALRPLMRPLKAQMQNKSPDVIHAHDGQPQMSRGSKATSAADQMHLANMSSLFAASSQLEVSLLGQLRSYTRTAPTGLLITVATLACLIAALLTAVMTLSLNNDGSESTPAGRTSQRSQQSRRTVIDTLLDHVDDLVQLNEVEPWADFETQDDAAQKTYCWKWCTPQQIQELGVLTQAPSKPFQGYQRIDVPKTEDGIRDIFESSNVDFTVFDFNKNVHDLLFKLIRTEAYLMLLDADLPTQNILVMMETVRIRWVYEGRVLTQEDDGTPLAKGPCLPYCGKPGSASPLGTAQNIFKQIFKLDPEVTSFVVDSVEDNEMVCYRGLQCVERSHIVDVQLRFDLEDDVLERVGLPKHTSFTSSDPSVAEAKRFSWMTYDECKAANVIMSDFEVFQPKRKTLLDMDNLESNMTTDDELREFLEHAGVDFESPGWQATRSGKSRLEDMAEEVATGRCSISDTSEGVHRCVNVVSLRLWSPDQQFMLVKSKSKYASGEEHGNVSLPDCKQERGESLKEAVIRTCQQKLSLPYEHVSFSADSAWEYYAHSETSRRYPGLLTKTQTVFVDVILEEGVTFSPASEKFERQQSWSEAIAGSS